MFEGKPYDVLDAALTDTISKFPLEVQPFNDMVEGMRMDLFKSRYQTFDELYEYCYRVAGTVGLMTMPVMGIDPSYKVSSFRANWSLSQLVAASYIARVWVGVHVGVGVHVCERMCASKGSTHDCISRLKNFHAYKALKMTAQIYTHTYTHRAPLTRCTRLHLPSGLPTSSPTSCAT